MSGCARSSGAGEILCVSRRCIRGKRGIRRERVRPTEYPGEVIQNAIKVKVDAKFVVASSADQRNVIDELCSLDGGLARAEVVAADVEVTRASVDNSFRLRGIRLAGFFVAGKLETKFVNQP